MKLESLQSAKKVAPERRQMERTLLPSEHHAPVVIHCGDNQVPGTIDEFSDRGVRVVTEIYDIAIFQTDPIAPGDTIHVQLVDDYYEGTIRHVTATEGVILVGVEWSSFTLGQTDGTTA